MKGKTKPKPQKAKVGNKKASRQMTERKQTEEIIHEMLQRFQMILGKQPYGILVVSSEGRAEFANQAFCDLLSLGEIPEALVGLTSEQVIQKILPAYADPETVLAMIKDVVARGQQFVDYEIPLRNGRVLLMDFEPLIVDGKNTGRMWIHRDVTERKRMEEAVALSEKRFRSIIEFGSEALSLLDETGTVVYSSPVVERLLGYTPEERIGHSVFELGHPDDLPTIREALHRVLEKSGASLQIKERLLHKDGNWHWFETTITNLLAVPAVHAIVNHSRDITEQMQAEEALRKAEERYRNIFENVIEAIIQTTPEGKYITANPATAHIFGYNSPEELMASVTDIEHQSYVKPGRRQEFMNLMEKHGNITDFESEVYRKDGSTIWISENLHVVRDENGTLLYYEGTAVDITERKRAENELRQSEEKFRNLFNNSEVGMFRTQLDGSEILDFNEKYLKILGYTLDELKGKPSVDRWADRQQRDRMIQLLKAEGRVTDFECSLLNKHGEVRRCITSLRLYRDTGILEGSIQDITERREAEEQLQKFSQRNAEALRIAHMGYWELDVANRQFTFNDQYYSLHGTTAEEAGGYLMSAEKFASGYVHPEDARFVSEAIRRAADTNDSNTQFQRETRILRADGMPRDVKVWFRIEKDLRAKPPN